MDIFVFVILLAQAKLCARGQVTTLDEAMVKMLGPQGKAPQKQIQEVNARPEKYTRRSTTPSTKPPRSTVFYISLENDCDYLAYFCLRAYKTGQVCGRSMYYNYKSFKNYCQLDFVNCKMQYEVWQIVHMGACFKLNISLEYIKTDYGNVGFLYDDYAIVN